MTDFVTLSLIRFPSIPNKQVHRLQTDAKLSRGRGAYSEVLETIVTLSVSEGM